MGRVAKSIHKAPNRVRYTMNGFIIAVGSYVAALTDKAVAVAKKVGKVSVDVGDVAERVRGVANTRIADRDPRALAEALVELVAQPRRSDGRSKITEISAQYIAQVLCGLYREAAAEGKAG